MVTGTVYAIKHLKSGKQFVGTTKQALSRIWSTHKSWSKSGRRSPLHDAIRKLNAKNFEIKHLETVSISVLRDKQQWWIDSLKSIVPRGFNRDSGNSGRQAHFNEVDVKKIHKLSKTNSQEFIARMFGVTQATISKILSGKTYR